MDKQVNRTTVIADTRYACTPRMQAGPHPRPDLKPPTVEDYCSNLIIDG